MAFYENFGNRRKGKHVSDLYKLDIKNKTPEENIKDIIRGLYLEPLPNDISPTNKHVESGRLGFKGSTRSGLESRKLAYLNALVTLLAKEDRNNLGFTQDELMTCIRVSLVDDSMVVRAAALRVLRYLIKSENDVATFNNLKLPYLVIRSMDLMLRNEEERASALRVVRRVVAAVGAASTGTGPGGTRRAAGVEPGLLRCLTAVARAGSAPDVTPDRLSRPAIATLAEICVLNPEMFIACGGVSAVTRQLAECATPRMAEALCGVLLHALNDPISRRSARIDLMCLNSPYCDFHFRPTGTESSRDEREMRFTCSRLALLCVLRSWPGLLHFCHPYSTGGLRALVAALYLPRLEVRKAILDLLYELVGLPQPEWTDEISVALNAVDPSDFQDSWRLNEGFVAEEGIAVLPHLGATGPDITEIHLALLLQCFFEAGLLDGLAEVIVTSDTFISVRATVLLGQLLQLMHALLPARSVAAGGAGLAALASAAAAGRPAASAAVQALRRLHAVRAARPASASLFLDHVVQCCAGTFARLDRAARSGASDATDDAPDADKSRKERDNADMARLADPPSDEELPAAPRARSLSFQRVAKSAKFFVLFGRDSDTLIKSTLVMQNKDGNTWNWEIIRTILKENDSAVILNLNDSSHKAWAARIMNYLRPSSNKYSHTDLSSSCHGHAATRAGCQLIRHLLKHNDIDSRRLLEEFFNDVSRQIEAIETGLKAHECLFSPQHMCNTMCQMYFLFIGQLCHSHTGLKIFKQTKLYENLLELSTKTHHSCYVKLVISSLDYTLDSFPRDILAKTLTCSIQASRLYTTQFLNVLLRATRKSRELVRRKSKLKRSPEYAKSYKDDNYSCGDDMETWILQLLVGQIKDECKEIVKIALTILEEGFSVPVFFEKMMPLKNSLGQNCGLDSSAEPSSLDLSSVGDRGYLLWLSLEVASAANSTDPKALAFLKKHLDFWNKTYNYRYVRVVEGLVHGALTLSACSGGGRGAPRWRRSARPPPHLHAALVRAPPARARALLAPALHEHYKILQRKKCSNEQEIVELKASLWAVGSTAVTAQGLQLLMNLSSGYLEESVVVHIVRLTKYSPVYAVRATAFYVLSLIGTTYDGANLLADLGWVCVRHTRHDQFPVIPDECYSLFEGGAGGGTVEKVTSPDRFAYEAEASEHSDHTDQSTAESLPSDHVRPTKNIPTDQDVVDHRLCPEKKDQDKRKSHTLPSQGCSTGPDRSMLSESRTVDILRDCSSYERPPRAPLETRLLIGRMNSLEHAPEGRVRNTSESSTSGVSSCDSFLGKYQIPDRVLTLSPIPSSSSLYGMKSSNSTQRPKVAELQRRTSTSSFAGHEVASSPPSQMDMTGYATLKSINRRPHLSESAATGPGTATGSSEVDDLSWLLADSNRRQKPFSSLRDKTKSTRERINKLSLLEYDWKPVGGVGARASPEPRRRPTPAPRAPAPHDTTTYMGICLPKDLMDIFPRDDERKEDEIDKGDQLKRGRLPSFLDASLASNEKSRSTPDSQKLSYSRGLNTTSSTNVRPFIISSTPNAKSKSEGRAGSKSDDVSSVSDSKTNLKQKPTEIDETNDKSDDTIKNDTSGSDVTKTEDNVKVNDNDRVPDSEKNVVNIVAVNKEVWRHAPADCLVCVRTRPPSSHELREAFLTGIDPTEPRSSISSPTHEKSSPQAQLLHQVHFMSNPIHIRQTRQVLLSLKQRHPDVFRSACVYSDVCALLSRDTYLLCARRFIQELFIDTSFDSFALEPANILARHK